jgi:N6-L-threonylcarbamoyladenine synthase
MRSPYNEELLILGIESSCDETAAAVVEDGRRIIASTVASQLDVHARYGGVVPELASREHLRAIVPVVRETMRQAGVPASQLDAIAVTQGPGLVGSLLVGMTWAKGMAMSHRLPLIGVHHLEGHIHAAVMESEACFPALALVVSGGHTHLFLCEEDWQYRLLGCTRDDAAGEAYDKVSKLLGFGYPGGPVLDQLAAFGNEQAHRFTSPKIRDGELDFSFSGVKTAVLHWWQSQDRSEEWNARQALKQQYARPTVEQWRSVSSAATLDVVASFQRFVVDELLRRLNRAVERTQPASIIITGGVASNRELRRTAQKRFAGLPLHFPTSELATDNAVMIAAAAWPRLLRRQFDDYSMKARASMALTERNAS